VIRAWRVVKSKYAAHAFDGEGSRLHGSRWSSHGVKVVHGSETLSLAILEILVHLQSSTPLPYYVMFSMEFDASLVERVEMPALPANWRASPPPSALQQIGDLWVRRGPSAVLEVPSALIPHERNFLLNPLHADFKRVVISDQMPLDVNVRVFH